MKRMNRKGIVKKQKRYSKKYPNFLEVVRLYADIPLGYAFYKK